MAEDAVESRECDPVCFPLQNFINVLQYLVMCTSLCPRAYSDRDKLLLLSLLCRVSLEKGLRLHPMVEIQTIIHNLLKSIRHWDTQASAARRSLFTHSVKCSLSELRPYLIRMKPSSLLKNIKAEKKWGNQLGEDQPSEISLDQEVRRLAS
ncbi:UNVERIFIED_CONTAM: hypothetical protein FKN15_039586 [Acipenser sinensis]